MRFFIGNSKTELKQGMPSHVGTEDNDLSWKSDYSCNTNSSDITDIIGHFGIWQKLICLAVAYFEFVGAICTFSSPFLAPDVQYQCNVSESYRELRRQFGPEIGALNTDPSSHTNCTISSTSYADEELPCTRWVYDHQLYKYSFTEEFDMVCSKRWLQSFSSTVTILGDLMACIVFGYISDRFGRRFTLIIIIIPTILGAVITLCSVNVYMFLFGRFLFGASGYGGAFISFILLVEVVGASKREIIGILVKFGWTTGCIFTGAVAYYLRDSYQMQLVFTLACIPLLPIVMFLPESPRWMLFSSCEHNYGKTKEILRAAGTRNGKDMHLLDDKLKTVLKQSLQRRVTGKTPDYRDLIRTPTMRSKFVVLLITWVTGGFSFYGLTLNTAMFGSDPALTFILMSAIEIPGLLVVNVLAHVKGYKQVMVYGYAIESFILVVCAVTKAGGGWVLVTAIVVAKFGITLRGAAGYNYGTDSFPTVVRALGVSSLTVVGKLFTLLSPFVGDMAEKTSISAVFYLLGTLALLGLLLTLILPNIHRKPVLETLEDGEKYELIRPCRRVGNNYRVLRSDS